MESNLDKTSEQMSQKLAKMQSQQTQLTRLFLEGVIGEEYKQLRTEWEEKLRHQRMRLAEAKGGISQFIDDLDMALAFLEYLPDLYERLDEDDKNQLGCILLNGIIVDKDGEIIECELNTPFTYLTTLLDSPHKGLAERFREAPNTAHIKKSNGSPGIWRAVVTMLGSGLQQFDITTRCNQQAGTTRVERNSLYTH